MVSNATIAKIIYSRLLTCKQKHSSEESENTPFSCQNMKT